MIRTQVRLTEEQLSRLKRVAAERGTSVAKVIRDAVDNALRDGDDAGLWKRALAIAGMGSSGRSDLGRKHDDYLERDFGE